MTDRETEEIAPMNQIDMIAKLREARALLGEVVSGSETPKIRSILKHADMNLHGALWNLGAVDGLRPDLEG